ncbi:MAG: LptF/LptG family permease [Pirellulaceae bacterium]|nr:LptF/LptG family permease [Pirellulaceae bacterium]
MVSHADGTQEKDFPLLALIFSPYYYAINRAWVVDRYALGLFFKLVIVCFVSLAGLYVVIDCFSNFQEFNSYGKRLEGGIGKVLAAYYGARLFWFFDLTAGVMAMVAGLFAVTWMQRANEMTALSAASIPPCRIVRPLAFAAAFVAALGVGNREVCLPKIRERLAKNAQDWLGETAKPCRPMFDMQSGLLISGKYTFANEKRIEGPKFSQLPEELQSWGRQITADNAYYQPATPQHPGGYLLRGVHQPVNLEEMKSLSVGGQPLVFSPAENPWLQPRECFVATGVNFEQLTVGTAWQQYLSTGELIRGLRNRSLDYGANVRVTLHVRLVQPFLDMALFFLGIPLVLTRRNSNIFVAGLLGLVLVGGFFFVTMLSHWLGANYFLSPALSAWLPLLIFGPLAFMLSRPLWD